MIKEIGKVSYVSPVAQGVSQKTGQPWANCTLVIEVQSFSGTYRKVALKVSSDQINDVVALPLGSLVEVQYKVTGREFNGKWYNDVNLYTVNPYTPQAQAPQQGQPQYQQMPQNGARQYPQQGQQQTTPYIPPQPAGPAFGAQGVDPDLGF